MVAGSRAEASPAIDVRPALRKELVRITADRSGVLSCLLDLVVTWRLPSALAAAARQAKIDMLPVRIADRLPFGYLNHLIDAAPRRIHFHAQLTIGGTSIQTQSAMHAPVEVGLPVMEICSCERILNLLGA